MYGPKPIWRVLYADDAGIASRSRDSLAKMMAVVVAVCPSFGLTVFEAKTETMSLMTNGMDRGTFVTGRRPGIQANRQVCVPSGDSVREC